VRRSIIQRVREAERPVVVFDVDSTLLSTARRHHRILREFAESWGDDGLSALVDTLVAADFGWEVHGPLLGTGFEQSELLEALSGFWFQRFFHPEYADEDEPIPGAVSFVNAVHEAGAWVYYLTARHLPELGPPTVRALIRHGFPLATKRTVLHLKPSRSTPDAAFKRSAISEIAALGEVVATFENDPANANALLAGFPDAVNVLLDTVCAADAPSPHPSLIRVPDFEEHAG